MPRAAKSTPAVASGPLEASVQPHEATQLPFLPESDSIDDAVRAVAKACNGFFYLGSDIEAQLRAIRFLRTRPDIAAALGVGA